MATVGPASARQWASVAPCAALGLSLVLPYGYPCAFTRALPVRSAWAIGVRSVLPILCASVCLPSGVPLAYFVRLSASIVGLPSACPVGQLVRRSAIPSAIPSMH